MLQQANACGGSGGGGIGRRIGGIGAGGGAIGRRTSGTGLGGGGNG